MVANEWSLRSQMYEIFYRNMKVTAVLLKYDDSWLQFVNLFIKKKLWFSHFFDIQFLTQNCLEFKTFLEFMCTKQKASLTVIVDWCCLFTVMKWTMYKKVYANCNENCVFDENRMTIFLSINEIRRKNPILYKRSASTTYFEI